ncbi:SCO2400 family protein, partial [Streptomyces decoyicus]
MDYCSSCRRSLNGALVCPGCGDYAPDIAPPTHRHHRAPTAAATWEAWRAEEAAGLGAREGAPHQGAPHPGTQPFDAAPFGSDAPERDLFGNKASAQAVPADAADAGAADGAAATGQG